MSDIPSSERPPTLDAIASARWNAWPHAQSPWLNEEVARRMQDRLEWIRLQPQAWIDWMPLSGGLATHALVRARYPQARCHVVEPDQTRLALTQRALQAPWWRRWLKPRALSFAQRPLADADMVWANMALHLSAQPQVLLREWHQTLAVDGFLMFSCLGPDTLRELHAVYQQQGWPAPSHAFTDMHDWGDMLVAAGFAEPVMDMEHLTLTYANAAALLSELRQLGRNLHGARFAGLRGRAWRRQLEQALLALAKPDQGGRLTLTVEVIYGHALKPVPKLKMSEKSSVSLQDMRTMLGRSRGN
ncbi:biotin synthase [Limnohabitans sp. JirII-29]|uniref:methyltransferase domain-containing protein n=1 Tax=unclassified Limnohabitans TaxID=2626134 RepID=UPI000C1ECFE3|nr:MULTISPECIES: methyltransferase domain-containing protein [unclassified Limnohabitans]PIT74306.1 biotin synthase [Limnohabitans sp. JirII-31]PUE23247.1 biotin synthase [Limnohabitans sp. JirII-29]